MNYLFVVAHPDDEVLGAGSSIYKLVKENNNVNICILSGEVNARKMRPTLNELFEQTKNSLDLLEVKNIIYGDFPNIEFNTVPHLRLVQFIEKAIIDTNAEVIFTHHPADLNNDHMHTSIACQEAVKIYQRSVQKNKIKELLFMEVLSSTDWGLNEGMNKFNPNVFVEVGEDAVNLKIKALSEYENVMREYPHSRSEKSLKALAVYRGSQAGVFYAEAFQSIFRIRE